MLAGLAHFVSQPAARSSQWPHRILSCRAPPKDRALAVLIKDVRSFEAKQPASDDTVAVMLAIA